jgi:hypothetical protein
MLLPAGGIGSGFLGCVKNGALRSDLSHAVSLECEAVSVVDDPIEDGVSDGRVCDDLVPISIGTWLVMMVDPRWCRSSTTSRRSRRCSPVSGRGPNHRG